MATLVRRSSGRERCLHAVVDAIRPVGGGDHEHKLDDLLFIQVLAEGVDVGRRHIAGPACEQVGEAQHRPLDVVERLAASPPGLLQRRYLRVGQALPLTRSGVSARSVVAAVADRSAQIRQLFQP